MFKINLYTHTEEGFLRVLCSSGMCSLRQLNSHLKSAMASAPWGSRSYLFFCLQDYTRILQMGTTAFQEWKIHASTYHALTCIIFTTAYWAKQVTFLNQTPWGAVHKNIGLGEWGALQAISTAAYYGSSIPGLLLMAKTIPILGSCYSLTKSLSYFCSYLIFWSREYFYKCSKIIPVNISENECLCRIQKYFKI